MKKTLVLLLLTLSTTVLFSQDRDQPFIQQQTDPTNMGNDGRPNMGDTNVNFEGEKPHISEYKIISFERDTSFVDTTLSIKKDYKYNYLRRDSYHLMPFANVGQTYNTLAHSFDDLRLKPRLGARARHFNYMEIEDINYFHVPTPLSELYFKTAFEQGQQLDAFFTINTSEQFNFSVAYKGLRSLGNYQNTLTSTGNFRFTTNYKTHNNRYNLRAHIVFQDLLNNENGGVKTDFIPFFINDEADFRDRGRLEVNFEDANNMLKGKRFHLEHDYALIDYRDSTAYSILKLGNILSFEDKFYEYSQENPFEEFGPAYASQNLKDRVTLEEFYAQAYAGLNNNLVGKLNVFIGYTDFNYGYDRVLFLNEETITNRILGTIIETGASYQKKYRGFELFGKAAINIAGEYDGNYLLGQASYELNEHNKAKASIHVSSVAPDYNFQLYQSDYVNYNWQTNFKNIKRQHLQFDLESKKLFNAAVSYTGIDDYAYFSQTTTDTTTTPFQLDERVNYLKVEASRQFDFGNFSLNTQLTYQKIVDGKEVFKAPEILGRASVYYSNRFFKNALFLQTGFTGKYFTSYEMNAYDPVLAEFYVQNEQEFGDFPLIDFFVNAKISQTRIYIKWEHFNSLFASENNYFSAPGHPYRDWKIRFGLVWNFFM
ncbi:putative porin [uncultured Planktosalinus sp.]|uniref:putative porin n=1 Tax=uncultured Planktosalinus sp. TaxID=1810935 RepID=UPI0030D9C8B1